MELMLEDSRVDYALKMGLASNRVRLSYYRKAIVDPCRAMKDPLLRPYAGELLDTLAKLVLTDPVMWTRLKTVLERKTQLREEMEPEPIEEEAPKTLDTLRRVLRERTNV